MCIQTRHDVEMKKMVTIIAREVTICQKFRGTIESPEDPLVPVSW
jgi:hypothetical protein